MAFVTAGGRRFDIDAIVFDKDDTLVDLNATWGPVARTWIGSLGSSDGQLASLLSNRLGYDERNERVVPDSILATHTIAEIGTHTTHLLSSYGWAATMIVDRIEVARLAVADATRSLPLRPLTDLTALFATLRRAGIGIGIFTSDDARPTRSFIESCGIAGLIDVVVTGDRIARPKPSGDGIRRAAEAIGAGTARTMMVGDSLHDHGAARDAGAWFVAVGHTSAAAALADASVGNVAEIVPDDSRSATD
jgi:phosphoglycolate phosphatase-like HAD superfamily hydrolase